MAAYASSESDASQRRLHPGPTAPTFAQLGASVGPPLRGCLVGRRVSDLANCVGEWPRVDETAEGQKP